MNGHNQGKPARRKRAQQEAAVKAEEDTKPTEPSAAPNKRRRAVKAAAAQGEPAASEGQAAGEGAEEGKPAAKGKPKKPRAKKAKQAEQGAAEEKLEWVPLPSTCPAGKLVGAHVSMASGIERAVINAASIGAFCVLLHARSILPVCSSVKQSSALPGLRKRMST
jgi:hypothetical protein